MPQQIRVRVLLAFTPEWEPDLKRWTQTFIRQNKWRTDAIDGPEDLQQECYMLFMKCCRYYPRVVEAKHFFSLYRASVVNKFNDKSLYMKRKREVHTVDTLEDVSDLYSEHNHAGYAAALAAEAPEELKAALYLLATNPEALRRLRGSRRMNLNAKFRKILRMGEGFDFMRELKARFT